MAVPVPIHQLLTHKFTRGHPRPLLAIVHHRMVGTLASTDTTFTTGERVASTHFGIGLCSKHGGKKAVCIHQYVRLGDQAWGNGNNHFPEGHAREGEPVPSKWNERNPKRLVNSRTISIEHQDNGKKGHPRRGIVPDEVIEASIFLDKLLLQGSAKKMKDAGIVFRQGSARTIAKELKGMTPGPDTIVDHNYIAGPLKPSCWQPWKKDDTGFPRHRYLVALGAATGSAPTPKPAPGDPPDALVDPLEAPDEDPRPPTSAEEDVMKSFATPTVPTLAKIRTDAWLYDNSALDPSPKNINVAPGREMPLIGTIANKGHIVSYVDDSGTLVGRAFWVELDDVASTRPAP